MNYYNPNKYTTKEVDNVLFEYDSAIQYKNKSFIVLNI